jgi:hypothetical protein
MACISYEPDNLKPCELQPENVYTLETKREDTQVFMKVLFMKCDENQEDRNCTPANLRYALALFSGNTS